MARKKKEIHEEHENHERWLVSYADMVTLLMVLFIVMFAMGQVDQEKFNALKQSLSAGFGQESTVLQKGAVSLLDGPGVGVAQPVSPAESVKELDKASAQKVADALAEIKRLAADRKASQARREASRLAEVYAKVHAALVKKGLADDVQATIDERGLVLSLVSKHVIFLPNDPKLSARGRAVVDVLAPVLTELEDPLSVDGHTNQVPVKPKYFEDDWGLSAERALNVVRYLHTAHGIPNARMTATAYGHEKPLIDPKIPGSQAVNKRVDIVVLTGLPEETAQLMKKALTDINKAPTPQVRDTTRKMR